MGSSMEEDHSSFIRELLNPGQVSVWKHSYKGSQFGLIRKLTCIGCNETKPSNEFYKSPRDGYNKRCRLCDAAIRRAKRANKDSMVNT